MIPLEIINLLVSKYYDGEIPDKEDIRENLVANGINEDDINNALSLTLIHKNDEELSNVVFVMSLCEIYSLTSSSILRVLLKENWHKRHEDIMSILEFNIHDIDCVNDVADAMHIKFDYMLDDGDAFIRKGAYVLATLKTDDSIKKLNELATDENEIIKKYATYQLRKLRGEEVDEEEDDD